MKKMEETERRNGKKDKKRKEIMTWKKQKVKRGKRRGEKLQEDDFDKEKDDFISRLRKKN